MVKLVSGGIDLTKVLEEAPHGKYLKNYSQINGTRIKKYGGDA
jgi:hypothetical protein